MQKPPRGGFAPHGEPQGGCVGNVGRLARPVKTHAGAHTKAPTAHLDSPDLRITRLSRDCAEVRPILVELGDRFVQPGPEGAVKQSGGLAAVDSRTWSSGRAAVEVCEVTG